MDVAALRGLAGDVQEGRALALYVGARRHSRSGEARQPMETAAGASEDVGEHALQGGFNMRRALGEQSATIGKERLVSAVHRMPGRGRDRQGDEGHHQPGRLADLATVLPRRPNIIDGQQSREFVS